jgi:hypothetical protein
MACITEGSTLSARLRSPPVSVRAGLQGCVAEGRAVADGDDLVRSPRPEKRTSRLQQGSWHVTGTANSLRYDLPFLRSYRNRLAAASYGNLCRWSPCWRGPVDQDMRALLDHLVGSDQQRSGMVRPSALAVLRFKTACPQAAPRSKAESLTTARAPELPVLERTGSWRSPSGAYGGIPAWESCGWRGCCATNGAEWVYSPNRYLRMSCSRMFGSGSVPR